PIWRKNRKALQSAFQYKMLEEFNRVFNEVGNKLVQRFEEILGRQVDVCPYVNHTTMDIIYESILGLDFDENPEENLKFSNNIYKYMDISTERMFSIIKRSDSLFQLLPDHKRQQVCLQEIRSFTTCVVNKRMEEMKYRRDDENSDDADLGIKKKSTFLDILLERFKNEKELPYDYINEELSTILTAVNIN
ncbi:PREDICTED: cytochrome P450 4c21-like, partial [Nicrophorus vespilloides]|uniref:Cytochrome P450 4c21-like n=1 Tax=Nicrophorus vespilloides TaxID=110193 RepID=A0ABM1N1A6_NICVS